MLHSDMDTISHMVGKQLEVFVEHKSCRHQCEEADADFRLVGGVTLVGVATGSGGATAEDVESSLDADRDARSRDHLVPQNLANNFLQNNIKYNTSW